VPALQFPNPWTAPLNFSDGLSHDLNSPNIAVTGTVNERYTAEYVNTLHEVEFASQQSLFDTISNGDEDEVTKLLSNGTSVHVRDGINNSLLHAAILKGNIVIVKSLLNYGADIDAIGFKRKTPLHLAIASEPLVQLLLKHSPKLSLQDDEGNTALHYLLNTNNWWNNTDARASMEVLLSSGADINITNKLGDSPLHRVVSDAIPGSDAYMISASEFLDHNPDVTSPMRNGLSPLSVFLSKSEIFSSPFYGYWGRGPLNWVKTGYRCLEKFLTAGADPNTIFHSKPLIIEYLSNGVFVEGDTSEKVLLKLIQKASIDVLGPAGNGPLHLALGRVNLQEGQRSSRWSFGTYEITAALISRNANVNQTNDDGASPLEILLTKGRHKSSRIVQVTSLLIEAGADTLIPTSTRGTLFDMLDWLPSDDQNFLTKSFLKVGAIAKDNANIISTRTEWVEIWRTAWKESRWQGAKARLGELQHSRSRPQTADFMEYASLVLTEHQLEMHKSELKRWRDKLVEKQMVADDCEDYCAILRDCRERGIEIDVSWYAFLLDLMDFNRGYS
jgi:ankyrin repeat protein